MFALRTIFATSWFQLLTDDKGVGGASVTNFQRHGKSFHANAVIFLPACLCGDFILSLCLFLGST